MTIDAGCPKPVITALPDMVSAVETSQVVSRMHVKCLGNGLSPSSTDFLRSCPGPVLDVLSTGICYQIFAEMPGCRRAEIDLSVAEGHLLIGGIKQPYPHDPNIGYIRTERMLGVLQRSIRLPDDADYDAVEADFENGVLIVTVGRLAPARDTTTIDIREVM